MSLVLEALRELRVARDAGDPSLARHWRVVHDLLLSFEGAGAGTSVEREEARQETLIKVLRKRETIKADTAASAQAWLRRVYKNTLSDVRRRRKVDPLVGRRKGPDSAGIDPTDRLPAQAPNPVEIFDDDALEPYVDALFDSVDAFLEAEMRAPFRAKARQRAEVAFLSLIRKRSADEIQALLPGAASREAIYKWVERGREQVLIPGTRRWLEQLDSEDVNANFASTLMELLEGSRRRDAGVDRPSRRKKSPPSVSAPQGCSSAQYGPEAQSSSEDEHDA